MMIEDLEYLRREAFSFDLEINPHAVYYETVEDHFKDHDDEDGWISPEQKQMAIAAQKVVLGRVYPVGSVTFFFVMGFEMAAVISECAQLCRTERTRYLRAKDQKPGENPGNGSTC
jgi:hypothetical protein